MALHPGPVALRPARGVLPARPPGPARPRSACSDRRRPAARPPVPLPPHHRPRPPARHPWRRRHRQRHRRHRWHRGRRRQPSALSPCPEPEPEPHRPPAGLGSPRGGAVPRPLPERGACPGARRGCPRPCNCALPPHRRPPLMPCRAAGKAPLVRRPCGVAVASECPLHAGSPPVPAPGQAVRERHPRCPARSEPPLPPSNGPRPPHPPSLPPRPHRSPLAPPYRAPAPAPLRTRPPRARGAPPHRYAPRRPPRLPPPAPRCVHVRRSGRPSPVVLRTRCRSVRRAVRVFVRRAVRVPCSEPSHPGTLRSSRPPPRLPGPLPLPARRRLSPGSRPFRPGSRPTRRPGRPCPDRVFRTFPRR